LNEQIDKFMDTEDQNLTMQLALRKAFRVNCDFYDPESDEWLQC